MNHQASDQARGSRRHFLAANAMSVSSVALAWLASREVCAEVKKPNLEQQTFDTTPKAPPGEPRAKAMISLWMQGGPSHHDLFDPKPAMAKHDGKAFPGEIKYDNAAQASSKVFATPWKFKARGACGMELSELIPHTASMADDICLIRSMRTGVNNHGQSIRALQTGRIIEGRPSLGSWLTYGLGTEADNLPAFMALIDPGQLPVLGVENWSNGWLPSIYQGTVVRHRAAHLRLNAATSLGRTIATASTRVSGAAQRQSSCRASRTIGSASSHRQLPVGGEDADRSDRSVGFEQRIESHPRDVRSE